MRVLSQGNVPVTSNFYRFNFVTRYRFRYSFKKVAKLPLQLLKKQLVSATSYKSNQLLPTSGRATMLFSKKSFLFSKNLLFFLTVSVVFGCLSQLD